MSPDPLQAVLEAAEKSGILSAKDRDRLWRDLAGKSPSTVQDAASLLIARKAITAIQADQVLADESRLARAASQGARAGSTRALAAGSGDQAEVLAGRYRLLTKLGQGGMGTVYLAQDEKLDRQVAIKVLPPGSVDDEHAVARFQREAKALAKLSHPGIVQAHDTDQADGRHFLVMEYVDGISLAQLLHDKGRLAPTQAADYIHQAALALQHAHEKGLIHRDLKPSNFLLTPDGQVKLLDLGLARFLQDQIGDPNLTREGMGMGTPDYTPPEQFRNAHLADARSDIYALGCTLYRCLTGKVPFPGSSLREKVNAHENLEPAPVDELCPDAPLGLSVVVSRMMAKRPADRFQSAGDVATALATFVGGSSTHAKTLKSTASWYQGQLTMTEFRALPKWRRRWWPIAAASLAGVAIVLALAGLQFGWFGGTPEDVGPIAGTGDKDLEKKRKEKENPADDPNVLTVSKDANDGGQCRTIQQALDKVKPGMTIRVLDDATYEEALTIHDRTRHARVRLESPKRATLTFPSSAKMGVSIVGVPQVTVQGFRCRLDRPGFTVGISAASPGVTLEDLDLQATQQDTVGVTIEFLSMGKDEDPVTIKKCSIEGFTLGIQIAGKVFRTGKSFLCRRIKVCDNRIVNNQKGIGLAGLLRDVAIVGNRLWNCSETGLYISDLMAGSEGILIANNSLMNARNSLLVLDTQAALNDITIRDNLILTERGPDLAYMGEDAKVLAGWKIRNNWRQVKKPDPADPDFKKWILSPDDKIADKFELMSLDPSGGDFLRPRAGSLLATGGAGGDLPAYVGAMPPEGVEPWNWQWTWDAYVNKLLTVSKDPKDGGRHRTIQDALAVVQPEMTIRVLTPDTFQGPFEINEPGRMQGLTLEAQRDAVIDLPPETKAALQIRGVPRVTVRGFRFTGKDSMEGKVAFIFAQSSCPGLRLERLNFQSPKVVSAVVVLNASLKDSDPPIIVRECSFQTAGDGIYLSGLPVAPTRRVVLLDNRVHGPQRGLVLSGCLQNVLVCGNQVWACEHAGIQLDNLARQCQAIDVVNNSIADCRIALRVWDSPPFLTLEKDEVRLTNNLFIGSDHGDVLYFRSEKGAKFGEKAKGAFLLDLLTFKRNARDMVGIEQDMMLPLASGDHKISQDELQSRQPGEANFLRPKANSLLATEGAGKEDPALPVYIGAVPPPGAQPWDWDRTWKAHFKKKSKPPESEAPESKK